LQDLNDVKLYWGEFYYVGNSWSQISRLSCINKKRVSINTKSIMLETFLGIGCLQRWS